MLLPAPRRAAPCRPGPPPGRCARGSRPLPPRSSTTPATRSSRPRRPPPARPRSGCTWPTGCSPRGAWRGWRSSRRRPTSAASGRWTPRATGSSWSPTGRTPPGPEPRDRHGVAVTYATVAAGAGVHRRRCAERPTLLIADEPHHMGEDATWGRSTVEAFATRPLPAAALGHAVSLGQLADPVGVLRRRGHLAGRLRLRLHAGAGRRRVPAGDVPHLRRRHGVGQRRPGAARRLRRHPARRRGGAAAAHRAGPRGRLDHPRAARRARAAAGLRAGEHPDAGGLVVAIDKEHAEKLAERLARITGERPDIVHSDAADASARIARFSAGSAPWLVSVLMVSEGVDVPRLRVGVYATTARTELFFRQVIGRFIRRTPAPKDQMSHVFLPSDPRLKRLATQIEEERNHALVFEPAGERGRRARRARARPARRSARCGRARAATTTCCRRPSPATRCSCSPSPAAARRWRRSRRPRAAAPAEPETRVRAPRAPARRAPRARGGDRAPRPARRTARSTPASTATSAPRRSTSRPTSSSSRPTACSSARLAAPPVASRAWTSFPSGRRAPSRCSRPARASRTRSRSRPRCAGPRTVAFALALRRESLARLREDPRCALTILAAGNVALTASGARPSSRSTSASRSCELDVERIQDHGHDTFVIDDGVQWRWTDADAERADAAVRAALRDAAR